MRKLILLIICIFILPLNIYGRTLKIGVSHFDPPFVMQLTPKHFSGFDINMMKFICNKLKDECSFIPMGWSELLDAVNNKKLDVAVSGFTIPQGHLSHVAFSLPYLVSKVHIIGLKNKTDAPFNIELLNNKKIGVTDSHYLDQFKTLKLKNSKFIYFEQDDALIEALREGKIHYALIDSYTANYWDVNSSNAIKDLGPINATENITVIAINPDDSALKAEINKALTEYLNSQDFIANYNINLIHL